LFRGVNTADVQPLIDISKRRQLDTRQYLLHQNSEAESVFTLINGTVMMERTSFSGNRQVVAFLYSGDFIGFTHNDEYEFSVQALTPVEIQEFPRKEFLQLADSHDVLKRNVREIGSNVLAAALDQLFALGKKKAHERICFLLEQLRVRQHRHDKSQIELIMGRQDIADYLGLTIETVSRAFARLKQEGLINIHSAHKVEILDLERLQELASTT